MKKNGIFKTVYVSVLLITVNLVIFAQTTHKPPAMGWASWNQFGVNINENIIKSQADAMVSSGLAAVGFQYINIDDGFFYGRNADGTLRINPTKFPNGMKYMADYIHSKGLKAGFYSDAGENTCGYQYSGQTNGAGVGLYGHDQQDCDLVFKTWGFDYYKVDYCGGLTLKLDEQTRYTAIKQAIVNTGRDVNYNVCRWQFPGTWVTKIADSWRMSRDINFVPGSTPNWDVIMEILDLNTFLAPYCSPGHYNDMDMLEVGRGLSFEEDKSHFTMWCILSSPLLLGNDLTKMSAQTKSILTNTEVIAINQDTTGLQAHLIQDNGAGLQVWAKNLNGRQSLERAVVLFNRSNTTASMTVKWSDLNLVGAASVRDLWAKTNLGTFNESYTASVPSRGVVLIKVTGTKAKLQEVYEAEYAWLNNFNLTQNTAILANQARASKDANCSGRGKVSYIGNRADNYIEFQKIYAQTAGRYFLSITYMSGENRNATVRVNTKDTVLTNLNSGSFSTLKTITIPVSLQKGYNTIRIFNASGWAPDLDKISINLNDNIIDVSISVSSNKTQYSAGETVLLTATTTISGGTISKVEFYNGTTKLGEDATSPYTHSWVNVEAGTYIITARATDNAGNITTSSPLTIKVNIPQGAYGGTPHQIPGKIEFENFDLGGNGIAYFDNTLGSQVTPRPNFRTDEDVDIENCTDTGGGYNLGWTAAGEWVEYTCNVVTTGTYTLTLRVACNGSGRTVFLSAKGSTITNEVIIPNTEGWQTWTDVIVNNIALTAGVQKIRLTIGVTDYVNLNYMKFELTPVSTPIKLNSGWNLIGCPIHGITDITKALSSIWQQVEVVKNFDGFYDKSITTNLNSLLKVDWGKGYMVKVKNTCELDWGGR
ncbi:MAG: carbohydrate-binding protein [Bacteroidales bacterium]